MRERQRRSSAGGAWRAGQLLRLHEPDFTQGVALYLDDISVSFDGFKALNALTLTIGVGSCAASSAQRRRQDDDDGCHHRQDPARRRQGFFGSTSTCCACARTTSCRPASAQVPEATVFEQLTVFENLELALKADRSVRASALFSSTVRRPTASARC